MTKRYLKNITIGFGVGAGLMPAFTGIFIALHLFFGGPDILLGNGYKDIFVAGYTLSDSDIIKSKRFGVVLVDFTNMFIYLGIFGALIGSAKTYMDSKAVTGE